MYLYGLFAECIAIPYEKAGVAANYATRRVGDTLYIFFEKSNGALDWESNLDFPAKPYKRMGKTLWFAHSGFIEVWKEIEPYLTNKILDRSLKKVIITGYSHGAAIALLCHEYVWYNRPDLRNELFGYGFGCPRVIWGYISDNIKMRFKKFAVIRNIDDIVTHLPPAFLGYRHVGMMLEIGEIGKYTAIEAHYEENILKELQKHAHVYNGVK